MGEPPWDEGDMGHLCGSADAPSPPQELRNNCSLLLHPLKSCEITVLLLLLLHPLKSCEITVRLSMNPCESSAIPDLRQAGKGKKGAPLSLLGRCSLSRLDHRGLEPGPLAVARLADDERLLLGLVTDLVVLPSSATSLSSTTMILRSPALSNQTKNATAPNTSSLPKTSSSTPSGSA